MDFATTVALTVSGFVDIAEGFVHTIYLRLYVCM